jgi:hypothetical protein
MSSILEEARRALGQAQAAARRTATAHQSAMTKVREAEKRLSRLEIAELDIAIELDALKRRASAGRT